MLAVLLQVRDDNEANFMLINRSLGFCAKTEKTMLNLNHTINVQVIG